MNNQFHLGFLVDPDHHVTTVIPETQSSGDRLIPPGGVCVASGFIESDAFPRIPRHLRNLRSDNHGA